MENHSTANSEQRLQALISEDSVHTYTDTFYTTSTSNPKSSVHPKNNTWLLLLPMWLVMDYKEQKPGVWEHRFTVGTSQKYTVTETLAPPSCVPPAPEIILPVLYISFLFIPGTNQGINSCFLK